MSDSGRKIDYTMRPAKCVERKIICELLTKFNTGSPIDSYRYIGFGSFYFTDFILFHNYLNIEKMISIENSTSPERYYFNKPYKCIDMLFCDALDALNRHIEFDSHNSDFIWLDYDDAFCMDMVTDIITASQKISKKSFLFISFNTSILSSKDEERLPALKEEFKEYLPSLREKDIDNESLPNIIYKIIHNAIQKSVSSKPLEEKLASTSLFFIKYRDGAPMLTLGYYFHDRDFAIEVESIKHLPGVTLGDVPINLKIPCFTKAEIREINRMLPGSSLDDICEAIPYIKRSDIEKYISLYKFYPNYVDAMFYT